MSLDPPTRGSRWRVPFRALRHRDFARVWTAGVISQAGDYVLAIGLPFFVYRLTGSVWATGTMFLVIVVPPIVMSSLAGVFVDRWNRRRTMVVTNVVLGAGLLPLLWVTSAGSLWIVYAVAGLEASIEPFFSPAEGALIPRLVPEAELVSANALYGGGRQIARLVGSAGGGILVGLWGIAGPAVGDAVSFVAAAAILLGVVESGTPAADASRVLRAGFRKLVARFREEWWQGLRTAATTPQARAVVAFAALAGIGEGVVVTLFAPFVVGVLHGSGIEYGLFVGVQAVGGIAGAMLAASFGGKWSPVWLLSRLAVVFAVLDGVLFTYPLVWPVLPPALILIAIVGLPAAIAMAAFTTLMQTAVSDHSRGRFLGAVGTSSALAMVVGILLATSLTDRIGIIPMLEVQVAAYLVGGLMFPRLMGNQPAPAPTLPEVSVPSSRRRVPEGESP